MSNTPRQPRKLHYLKCYRCRADRQKCTPIDRPWPGPKCDRCIKFNYPCSASVTAQGDLAKSLNVSQISQGREPVPLNFNVEDFSNGVGPDQSEFHALWDLYDPGQSFPAVSPIEPPLTETPLRDQARPGCAKFFIMLQHAIWGPTKSRPADPPADRLIPVLQVTNPLKSGESLQFTRTLYRMLRLRESLVKTSREHEVKIQQEIARGMSRAKAVNVIITDFIANAFKELPEKDYGLSPVQHILAFTRMLREGDRWRELVDTVGSREILLMDVNHPKCPRNYSRIEDYSEIGELVTLECCSKRCTLGVDRIMMLGTDEVFEKFKKTLLSPELRLELTCQRLNGLVTLIYRLFQKDDSKDPVIKWFSSRLHHLTRGPFKDDLSDLDSFLISEIPRRIKDVFGPDPFPLLPERSDTDDDDDDDDNDVDNDNDDDGDDDGSFRSNVFGNNEGQNTSEFSEDFDTRFSSTNPFAPRWSGHANHR